MSKLIKIIFMLVALQCAGVLAVPVEAKKNKKPRRPNLLLVTFDTTRADRIGSGATS